MNEQFYSYAPEDTVMVITWEGNGGGTHVVEGVADGTFITVTPEGAPITTTYGAYNSMARTIRSRSNASFEVTLMDGSPTNDVFSALHNNDRTARRLDWVFQLTLKSGNRTFFSAPVAFIEDYPARSFGDEAGTLTWVIYGNNVQQHIGGSGFIDSDTAETLQSLGYEPDPYWVK